MNLSGTEYYYIRNAQGDIIGLLDKAGTQVVAYTYDTWGKLISTTGTLASTVGAKNPYRYRGYRYDGETGLYYLNARYYNAEWGRFINADEFGGRIGKLLSHNTFVYCLNNPVNMKDSSGCIPTWLKWVGGAVAVVAVIIVAIVALPAEVIASAVAAVGAVAAATSQVITRVAPKIIQTASKVNKIGSRTSKFKFSQTTASPNFSNEGKLAGNTIGQVAQKLKSGNLKPPDVPIEYITRENTNLILNTRSSLALKRANIPVEKWNLINRTGDLGLENHLTQRLMKNGLTNTGTDVIRITGFGKNASSLK